jgi:hypothetical protein
LQQLLGLLPSSIFLLHLAQPSFFSLVSFHFFFLLLLFFLGSSFDFFSSPLSGGLEEQICGCKARQRRGLLGSRDGAT